MSTDFGARRLENKIMESHAAKKIYAKNFLKEVANAMSLGKEWINDAKSKDMLVPGVMVRKAIKAGRGGRLVGADGK